MLHPFTENESAKVYFQITREGLAHAQQFPTHTGGNAVLLFHKHPHPLVALVCRNRGFGLNRLLPFSFTPELFDDREFLISVVHLEGSHGADFYTLAATCASLDIDNRFGGYGIVNGLYRTAGLTPLATDTLALDQSRLTTWPLWFPFHRFLFLFHFL
jgi:hypothetical protein